MGLAKRLLAFDSLCGATARVTECLLAYYRCFRMSTRLLHSLVSRPPQILSHSHGEKSGEGLGSKLRHGPEMVDSVSTSPRYVLTESTMYHFRVHKSTFYP